MTQDLRAVSAAVSGMLGTKVAIDVRRPGGDPDDLIGSERVAAEPMAPRRRAEFSAGRAACRRAMTLLGLAPTPVPMAPDRSPVWPPGLVGSISHSDTVCLAALAPAGDVIAIGVDIEPDKLLPVELAEIICSDVELAPFETQQRARMATVIFAAKECAYKCQYPLTQQVFGFDGLQIALDLAERRFTATFRIDTGIFPAGHEIAGRFGFAGNHVVAAMALRSAPV